MKFTIYDLRFTRGRVFNAPLRKTWNRPNGNQVWLTLVVNQDTAEMVISGEIGKSWWDNSGTSGKEFRDALSQIPRGHKINLRINSEGGSVQDGLDIYNAIKERRADVTSHITGYAVSIASVIPLAASRVISPTSSIWMIHEPWSLTQGDAEEHKKAAEMLDKHGDMLAQIYAEETGKSKKAMREAMQAETWFTGKEAVEFGLADETEADDEETIDALKRLDLRNFRNVPAAILNSLSPLNRGQSQPPENSVSMIKKLVALLKANSIEASETDTEEQLLEKLTQLAASKKGNAKKSLNESIRAILAGEDDVDNSDASNRIAALERARISDKLDAAVDANKITKAEAKVFLKTALRSAEDEKEVFDIIAERKAPEAQTAGAGLDIRFGTEDAGPADLVGRASQMSPQLKNIAEAFKGEPIRLVRKQKIYDALKADWANLTRDARQRDSVRNENTIAANLTTNFLILGATTQASPKFASVKMFSRDVSVDPYKPLATGQMKFNATVQDGSTAQTNATNFETGDSTVNAVAITVSQYTESFHITNAHLNDGIRMEDLVVAKLASLGSKVSKVLATNITAANFATLTPVISAIAAFGFSDMATARGNIKKAVRKHIMLDGEYLSRITNQPGFFQATPVVPGASWKNVSGWDYLAEHHEWSAAGNNIRGFACDPQALGVIAGLPLMDMPGIPGGILAMATGMLPYVDLPIAVFNWFNTSTRVYWGSFDLMFGANALDTTIGDVIATGQPS